MTFIYNQKETEQFLGVTTMTLYNWRKSSPPLPHETFVTNGGARRNRYNILDVLAWVEAYAPRVFEQIGGPDAYRRARGESSASEHSSGVAA